MNDYKLIDKQGKQTELSVPTKWSDVSYGTYNKIINTKDKTDSNILRLLLGVENVEQLVIADNFHRLSKDINFISKPIDLNNYVPPTKVTIKDKEYPITIDIGKETIGQYNDLKDSLNNDKIDHTALACAIYIQPEIDGVYNMSNAKKLQEDLNDLPCDFVLVIGNFFLSRLLGLKNGLMNRYRKASTRPRRFRQVIQTFQTYLGL